jgi:hypothetical protein
MGTWLIKLDPKQGSECTFSKVDSVPCNCKPLFPVNPCFQCLDWPIVTNPVGLIGRFTK